MKRILSTLSVFSLVLAVSAFGYSQTPTGSCCHHGAACCEGQKAECCQKAAKASCCDMAEKAECCKKQAACCDKATAHKS